MMEILYEHLGVPITTELYHIDQYHSKLLNKPSGGLWGSRSIQMKDYPYYRWREWVESEDYKTELYLNPNNCFNFKLNDQANILLIDGRKIKPRSFDYLTKKELRKIIPYAEILSVETDDYLTGRPQLFKFNWEYIFHKYDGIELINGNLYCQFRYNGMSSWDCDSICIWNPDIVIEEKNSNG